MVMPISIPISKLKPRQIGYIEQIAEITMILETLAITGVVAAFATKYLMEDEKRSDCFSTFVQARRPNIRN